MKTGVRITRDRVQSVLAAVKRATRSVVLIGIPYNHTARPGDPGISNAVIGHINEFGSPLQNIPARPHLVPGVISVRKKATDIMADGLTSEMLGEQDASVKSMHQAGIVAVIGVKTMITNRLAPALSNVTLQKRRAKGRTGDMPLIDTAQYLNAQTYVIRQKGAANANP